VPTRPSRLAQRDVRAGPAVEDVEDVEDDVLVLGLLVAQSLELAANQLPRQAAQELLLDDRSQGLHELVMSWLGREGLTFTLEKGHFVFFETSLSDTSHRGVTPGERLALFACDQRARLGAETSAVIGVPPSLSRTWSGPRANPSG
jgi:hypothetical protein